MSGLRRDGLRPDQPMMGEFVRRNPILAALAGAAVLLAVALVLEYAFLKPAVDTGAGRKAAPGRIEE